MLRNIEVQGKSFFAGLDLRLQTVLFGKPRGFNLPFYVSNSETSVRGEKAGGQVAFERRKSFPLPPARPGRLLAGPIAIAESSNFLGSSRLELGPGVRNEEPIRLYLRPGLLGDGPIQAEVSGRVAQLATTVVVGHDKGFSLYVDPSQGQCYARIKVI